MTWIFLKFVNYLISPVFIFLMNGLLYTFYLMFHSIFLFGSFFWYIIKNKWNSNMDFNDKIKLAYSTPLNFFIPDQTNLLLGKIFTNLPGPGKKIYAQVWSADVTHFVFIIDVHLIKHCHTYLDHNQFCGEKFF